jgi:DHA2 family multidrug resistance protein
MMPRGIGAFAAMFIVGQLVGRIDSRVLVSIGLFLSGLSAWQMSKFSLDMTSTPLVVSAVIQGLGTGLIFVPLTTLAFASLSPIYRAEGSSVFTLVRNLGSSAGISIVEALQTNNVETVHSGLVSHIVAGDPNLAQLPAAMNPATQAGAAALNGEITRQASMVAYVDDFRLMLIITIAVTPLLFLMKAPRAAKPDTANVVHE